MIWFTAKCWFNSDENFSTLPVGLPHYQNILPPARHRPATQCTAISPPQAREDCCQSQSHKHHLAIMLMPSNMPGAKIDQENLSGVQQCYYVLKEGDNKCYHQNGHKSKARYTKTKDSQCAQTQATQQQRALIRSKSVERIR